MHLASIEPHSMHESMDAYGRCKNIKMLRVKYGEIKCVRHVKSIFNLPKLKYTARTKIGGSQ